MKIQLFSIGFTEKSAEQFFRALALAGVKRVIDVRLNNTSQLAGFSKRDDLKYFLREVAAIDYVHIPELAPTQEMFDAYKKEKGSWAEFEREFKALLASRGAKIVPRKTAHLGCLLCSEKSPHHCHRRLVAEFLESAWGDVSTKHLD
ncbi:MAG TPA: DUF488 domain-containing protein [Planctomycetota bacterium]|nr:DUF488 domain-containing protein [Planctomycetota bacterium]